MDFDFTPEHEELREAVCAFATQKPRPTYPRKAIIAEAWPQPGAVRKQES